MGYVEKNLVDGEELLLRPHYHWVRFLPGFLVTLLGVAGALAALALAGPGSNAPILLAAGAVALIGLATIAYRALVDSFDEFAVTSLRVIKKTGFLTRRVVQIPLDKVQDVELVATLWGRWLAYGDVRLESAGEEGPVAFPRIQNPETFRNVLFTWRQRHPLAATSTAAPPSVPRASVEERLREAERLRASGVITEEEYRAKREALLREL